jgi:Glycoside-hydrolase family GH114
MSSRGCVPTVGGLFATSRLARGRHSGATGPHRRRRWATRSSTFRTSVGSTSAHAGVRTRVVGQLDLARERNCDGVEPDTVDGFANDTGFDLSAADQLAFNRFLAAEAHERDLAVGLKNDMDQVAELARDFDFAVNEQCHEFAECEALMPFVDAGKPVFKAEYHDTFRRDPGPICDASQRLGLQTLALPTELDDSFHISCDDR